MTETNAKGMIGAWLWRPTLSRRIALAMVVSLVAVQAQAFLQIRLLSNPEFRMVGTRWLAEATQSAAHAAFGVPQEQRKALLLSRAAGSSLRFSWSATRQPGEPDDSGSLLAAQLAATLRDVFGDAAKIIHIQAATVALRFPLNTVRVTVAPGDTKGPLGRGPVRPGEPDVLIPAGMRISVQGQDDSWVVVEPIGFNDSAIGASLPYLPLLAGGLIIVLFSMLTARRIMAPLDRLVIAAERIGTAREPVRVETVGLHEFASVARAFEDMQQRLLRFVEDRTRILAAISHDLRSSLTRLRLTAEQCAGEAERAALSIEIDDMQSMVESTLAFASGEAQLAPNRPTDIAAMLISLVDEATDAGKPCTYQGPDHIETMGHPVSLKRAFWNVIDNALKYGTTARVGLDFDDTAITVIVDDDGPGIPEASRNEVFVPFRRLDPARGHQTPGVGLGLTIVRDVIQSHGGTISLNARQGGGLRVTMQFPRR
jgi:signal transduction histidine kinase